MSRLKGMISAAAVAVGLVAAAPAATGVALASSEGPALHTQSWSFEGLTGHYDKAQLKRGWEVYANICHSCHPLDYMHYRDLEHIGYTEDEVKAIASKFEVQDGPDEWGDMFTRPATPLDEFAKPYENDAIAKLANGGAVPPNLSVMARARDGGADYIYSLLLGFEDKVPDWAKEENPTFSLPAGKHFNTYFPGWAISMPPQLFDGIMDFSDGTKATPEEMAKDVAAFLQWASEPELEQRKTLGRYVLVFLLLFTGILYLYKREVWKDVH